MNSIIYKNIFAQLRLFGLNPSEWLLSELNPLKLTHKNEQSFELLGTFTKTGALELKVPDTLCGSRRRKKGN